VTPEGIAGEFEPSEGTISDTSAKFWVIERPSFLGWSRVGPDPTVEDTYPDPEPFPTMTYPEEPLPEGWELHWSKTHRTPYYYHRSWGVSDWEWPSDHSDRLLWTRWVQVNADIQYTCLRQVRDPNSEFFEHTLALMNGWVVGVISPQTQLAPDDTRCCNGHEPTAGELREAIAIGEYITLLTLDML